MINSYVKRVGPTDEEKRAARIELVTEYAKMSVELVVIAGFILAMGMIASLFV